MPSTAFRDSKGREWSADFTVSAIKRVKARNGVDLSRLAANEFQGYIEVAGDPVKFAEVLYTMAGHQHPEVSEDDFLDSLVGDALHAAAEAFQEGFLLFCPSRQREAIRTLTAQSQHAETMILNEIMEKAKAGLSSTTVSGSPA